MIFMDFEVFKHDFVLCWLDAKTKKMHHIVNDKAKVEKFYEYYKNDVMVGYNIRNYDQWILKSILCDFDPWKMNEWIITKERKGFEYSKLLNKFPVMVYDCAVGFRSLKELEAFMGDDIRESQVPWNINRPLTKEEMEQTLFYCKHDVWETFKVFLETVEEWESHVGLIKEFNLGWLNISKTKPQLSAMILGASKRQWDDEFDISLPDTLQLGKYQWIGEWYLDWAKNKRNYDEMELETIVNGVKHKFAIGGLHGAIEQYFGEGLYLMADVGSFYPALMIEYGFLSRNVSQPKKFKQIRDDRIIMKKAKDPRQQPRKIVLNATFGASKDQYNNLYDPRQANNVCVGGQLFLTDLLDKLDGKCQLIQSNTDGILVKLYRPEDKESILNIFQEWCDRTRLTLEVDEYVKVIQKDVNNYIIVDADGHIKRKGAYVKKLSKIDNNLPIVNRAVVDYFTKGIPVEQTILGSDALIDFQIVTKISSKYEYGSHNGKILHEKIHRCFASLDPNDGILYKKKKDKTTLDKTASTPEHCFIDNSDVSEKKCPEKLDKQWYINLAKERIKDFIGK